MLDRRRQSLYRAASERQQRFDFATDRGIRTELGEEGRSLPWWKIPHIREQSISQFELLRRQRRTLQRIEIHVDIPP